jgi:hypothetical protein
MSVRRKDRLQVSQGESGVIRVRGAAFLFQLGASNVRRTRLRDAFAVVSNVSGSVTGMTWIWPLINFCLAAASFGSSREQRVRRVARV